MPRFSANLVFLWSELPFRERFAAAASAGFEAVEYMFPYPYEPADLAVELSRTGLRQDLFNLPAGDFDAGDRGIAVDPGRRAEFDAGVEAALRYADALGCRKANCLVGTRLPGLAFEDQYECLAENLRVAAGRLGADGVTLLVELLNTKETPGFFLDSVPMLVRLLDDVGSPNLRFQCDLYHLQRTSGDLTATIHEVGDRIGHVQIADAPDRHEPGTGEIDFPFVLRAIDAAGYDGFVGLEYRPSGRTEDSFGWIEAYGYSLAAREEVS